MLRVKCLRNVLFNSDTSLSIPSLSLRNVVSSLSPFFFTYCSQKHSTGHSNMAPIEFRGLHFSPLATFIFCPSRHMSCSIQSYFSDQWVGPTTKSGNESDNAFHCNQENHRNGETDICGTDWSTVPGSRNGTKTLT